MTQNMKSQRIFSFDIIRVIAIMAVVMIHVAAPFVVDYAATSKEFFVGNICDSLSRIGVPLFVMLSGALLLKEDKPFPMKKMFQSTLILLISLYAWSFIYAVTFKVLWPLMHQETINWISFGKALIMGHYHQWYLFMIIGIYLITPVLKTFVKQDNIRIIQWLIILSIIFRFSAELVNFFLAI